ncbi:hypothetical protein C8R45DRAFT_208734 [Mycena sanguinolenta]|nr:hypothetical protein C8R45DRAFT_208734 [Mycena sanguinolenta]
MSGTAAIHAQMSDLEISLQEHAMRTRLQSLQSQLNSVTYPVLSLPFEIASEISVHCLPSTREWDVVNTSEAPVLLMHVCQAWRRIALSLPTTFDVDLVEHLSNLSIIAKAWFHCAQTTLSP